VDSPYEIIPSGVVNAICADDPACTDLAACLLSTDVGNAIVTGTDGKLWADPGGGGGGGVGDNTTITMASPFAIIPLGVVSEICSDVDARTALSDCLISLDPNNGIVAGIDGRLWSTSSAGDGITISILGPHAVLEQGVVDAICLNAPARLDLVNCLISDDADNALVTGLDGNMFVDGASIAGVHVLHGSMGLAHGNILGVAAGTIEEGTTNIPIPNSSPVAIDVQLEFSGFAKVTPSTPLVTLHLGVYDGSAGTGILIAYFRVTNEENIKTYDMRHNAILNVPAGGRTISVRVHTVAGAVSPDTDFEFITSRTTWYGVRASASN
jgi:hypothetical protein